MYLGGGAVIVLGGLGYWLMRRRRRQETAQGPVAKVAPLLATPGAGATVAQQRAPEEAAAELDPLDEATVYLTHGRDAQAEAILTEAIPRNPGREALHVKLLEVYALRKDKAAFAKRAEDFHKLTGGTGDNWIKVAAMGFGLDPGNPLYGAAKDASLATPAAAAVESDLDFNLDAPATAATSPAPVQASAAPAPADAGTIDFEIEVPKLDVPPAAPAPTVPPAADSGAALDFKLDLGALDLGLDDKKPGAAVPAGEHDAHWHDVQAKFDLAKAYQEMGDKAGAGEILKEVIQEGDAEQQAKAKTLLDSLG
jgi:pilus assembly protein FimV